MMKKKVGIPYAWTMEDGSRVCPECRERIRETFDSTGEQTSNNYGAHWVAEHAEIEV